MGLWKVSSFVCDFALLSSFYKRWPAQVDMYNTMQQKLPDFSDEMNCPVICLDHRLAIYFSKFCFLRRRLWAIIENMISPDHVSTTELWSRFRSGILINLWYDLRAVASMRALNRWVHCAFANVLSFNLLKICDRHKSVWVTFSLENMCVVGVAEIAVQVIRVPVTIHLKASKPN